METMTNGRTYVQIGGEEILRIVQMDENNRRNRVIEFDKKISSGMFIKGICIRKTLKISMIH